MSEIELAVLSRAVAHLRRGIELVQSLSHPSDTIEDDEGRYNGTQD